MPFCPSNKLTFDLESDVRVTCDVGYLCRLRPNVHDRQTDVRQTSDSIIA